MPRIRTRRAAQTEGRPRLIRHMEKTFWPKPEAESDIASGEVLSIPELPASAERTIREVMVHAPGALGQARDARLFILDVMAQAIDTPDEMAPTAPRVLTVRIIH